MAEVLPEPLRDHFVVVSGRRFPPKQVLAVATGLDRADFITHQARRVLQRLGFVCGRVSELPPMEPRPAARGPHDGREAELLRPHRGKWVAQRGLEVLVAAASPQEVLAWLERHDREADAMFLVPEEDWQAGGPVPA